MRALLVLVLLLCVPGAMAQKMDRPNYKVGDTWVYEQTGGSNPGRIIHKVTQRTESGGYQITSTSPTGKLRVTWTIDADGNVIADNGRPFKPVKEIWRFPLEVGKTYEGKTYQYQHSRKGITVTAKATVRSITMEKVTTPAGSFDAFKVEVRIAYQYEDSSGYHNSQDITYWLAPDVGRFVKYEFVDYGGNSRFELNLLEYKRAP